MSKHSRKTMRIERVEEVLASFHEKNWRISVVSQAPFSTPLKRVNRQGKQACSVNLKHAYNLRKTKVIFIFWPFEECNIGAAGRHMSPSPAIFFHLPAAPPGPAPGAAPVFFKKN